VDGVLFFFFARGRLTDPKTRDLIDSLGIKLFGYRDLQKLAFKPV
jgi:hypothetical protein